MRRICLLLIVLSGLSSKSQENFGIAYSSYATTNAIQFNPANGVLSQSFLDVNLVGAKAFVNNNLAYLDKNQYSLKNVLQGNFERMQPKYNLNSNKTKGFVAGHVYGPSFVFSKGNHAFGLHINGRSFLDVRNISNDVVNYAIDQTLPSNGTYTRKNLRGGALSYAEIGGHYSTNLIKKGNSILSAGLNFNYLVGLGGAGGIINEGTYTVNGDNITLNNIKGEYMYSEFGWNKGRGMGGSLGVNYTIMEGNTEKYLHNTQSSDCDCMDHKLKLGASLIDLGFVNFKNGTTYRNFDENTDITASDATGLDQQLASATNTQNQNVWSQTKVYLPGALSVQADYKVMDYLYASASYTHGFRKGTKRFGVQRPKVLNFTPRLQGKRFELALPVSLYEWTRPQLGAAVRLNNNLVIGTDKLGALTGGSNVYGADIYFNLKLGLTNNPSCKDDRARNPRSNSKMPRNWRGKEDKYSCPQFN